ncbi:MAG: hypothetical protein ACRC6K_00320 [Fusobacteriaceae bacterium]
MKKIILLFFLMTHFNMGYSEDRLSIDELHTLKEKGMLSQEDYDILIAELSGTLENQQLYKLNVNGNLIDDKFKVLIKGDSEYFPVLKFLELLEFFNLKQTENEINVSLKESLTVILNKNNNTIELPNNKEFKKKILNEKNYLFKKDEEYFLRSDIFKDIFLNYLSDEGKDSTIRMNLAFNTPKESSILFELKQKEIKKELEKNEIVYVNKRKIFELGNTRVQIYQKFDKLAHEDKYKKDWEGSLEYQGAVLYGNLTTSYDFKENQVEDIEIEYEDIVKDHSLKLGAYEAGYNSREFGFSLKKDKGYYELGRKFIIREDVPIGSKVELLYMGYPIEVKDAENGSVTFDSSLIRADRSYQLKVYGAKGDVETRYINTAQNYNQQNKDDIEYDIFFREEYNSKKYRWNIKGYYGLTNEITLGLGNKRTTEKVRDKYKFLDEGRMEVTYSNQINNNTYPVILQLGNERTLTKGENSNNEKYEERYKYDGLAQINLNDWRLKTEVEQYGKFYREKSETKYGLEYSGFNSFTLGYEYEISELRSAKKEDENRYKIYYDKGLTQNLLLSSEVEVTNKNNDEYRMDFFYTGFASFNINWKNAWKKSISNYETELDVYSNNFYKIIDYSFGVKYSVKLKERVVFSFNIDYDNFFKIVGKASERGGRNLKLGVDRVVDLKNIKAKVDKLDSSRVKVISFIDGNNNNIYDAGETKVDNVEIKIGDQSSVTNEKGEAMFYGVPNNILLNLQPTIRKPSYSLGNNIIKIKGITTTTIEAYIPVKPMLTLIGRVELDKIIKLSSEDRELLYSNILIKLKDIKGNQIELIMPDETGNFIVSGIFPDKYLLEVKYKGNKFNLPELEESLELIYIATSTQKIILNVTNEKFIINTFLKDK